MLLNRLTAAGLFLAGLAALGLTMAMNWRFGQGLAIEADSYLSASAYLVIDSMTALSALALGQRVAVKAWTSAAVAGVALVLFGMASMISLIGFGASNRMAIAAAAKAEGEAIAGQHQEALKARLAHADWLRKQSLTTNGADMSKADRKLFLKESTDAVKSVETMSTPKIDPRSIIPDAQATVLANLAGVPVEKVQFALVALLSVLLIVAKATAMGFAGLLWSAKPADKVRPLLPMSGARGVALLLTMLVEIISCFGFVALKVLRNSGDQTMTAGREHGCSPPVVRDEPGRGQGGIPGAVGREHVCSPSVVGDEPGRGQRGTNEILPEPAKSVGPSSYQKRAAACDSKPHSRAREEREGSSSNVDQVMQAPSSPQRSDAAPQGMEGRIGREGG
jgi:hypothetical protein